MRAIPAAVISFWLMVMAGCVTETKSTGPTRPGDRQSALLPAGPIAAPARGISTSSRVLIGLASVGTIPYDGQVLPLISPDGHFCAVQDGDAPTWPTLLAAPDAQPVSAGTRIAVYDLTTAPPARLETAASLEPGLVLGRATDHRGFLVESPRPNGARWIGRVDWQSGNVQWLVREEAVCAHGMFTTDGSLLFVRRPISGQVSELVLRVPSGETATRSEPGLPYDMPMATTDPSAVYALCMTASGIELHALSIRTEGSGSPRLGPVLARRLVSSSRDAATAYQIAAPMQSPEPRTQQGAAPPDAESLVIFSPLLGRMCVFDVRSGSLLPLAPNSVAAIRWIHSSRPGYLCTTPKGLVFTPEPQSGRASELAPPDARILAEAYVPRRTMDPKRPAILFGPVKSDPRLLELISVAPVEADDGAAKTPADSKLPAR